MFDLRERVAHNDPNAELATVRELRLHRPRDCGVHPKYDEIRRDTG